MNDRVYEYGPSMIAWMLYGKEKINAGPLEFYGYRQTIIQVLADEPMTVHFIDANLLDITYNGETSVLQYRKEGKSLEVKNLKTGLFGELGKFNDDGTILTIADQYILDRTK